MDLSKTVEQALADHRLWVESDGEAGERFDLSGKFLEGIRLYQADLTGADMTDATIVDARGVELL